MIQVQLELTHGLAFGIEHVAGEEDDFFEWAVPVHLGIFRLIFIKLKI